MRTSGSSQVSHNSLGSQPQSCMKVVDRGYIDHHINAVQLVLQNTCLPNAGLPLECHEHITHPAELQNSMLTSPTQHDTDPDLCLVSTMASGPWDSASLPCGTFFIWISPCCLAQLVLHMCVQSGTNQCLPLPPASYILSCVSYLRLDADGCAPMVFAFVWQRH